MEKNLKPYNTTTAAGLKEVEGEIFTVDQFTCGVHKVVHPVDEDGEILLDTTCPNCNKDYDEIDQEYQICHHCDFNNILPDYTVTELGTGMQVVSMVGTKQEAIKEARRLFAHNDPGRFMMRAKATLRDMGIGFPVNDPAKFVL